MNADLHKLVRRVLRRMIWSEQLRRIQLSFLLATLAAATISLAFILLGRSTLLPPIALPIAGLLVGCAWAMSFRVTSLQAATRIDERFGLKDLLATAWQIQESALSSEHPADVGWALPTNSPNGGQCPPYTNTQIDPWKQTICDLADARCRRLNSSEMGIRLFNRPAWSIVGLSSMLTLILGLWSPHGQPTSSAEITQIAQFTPTILQSTNRGNRALDNATHSPIERDRPPGNGTIDESPSQHGATDSPQPEGNQRASNGNTAPRSAATDSSDPSGVTGDFGRSPTLIPKLNEISADATTSADTTAHGIPAGGGSGVGDGQTSADIHGSGGLAPAASNAPPWQAKGAPSVQPNSAPLKPLQTPRFDPAFDDLIRDYFTRP